jgi:peptide chain release factor 1
LRIFALHNNKNADMLDKLEAIKERFYYLEEKLSDPEVLADMKQFSKINKEYKSLQEIVNTFDEYKEVLEGINSSKSLLKDSDPEMREMAEIELGELSPKKEELEELLKMLLIPKDPNDDKDVIMEIRSGTGGDEASIFAGDLYRMYTKYFESRGWKTEIIDINEGSVGGYNKIVIDVNGDNVYGRLKFESGAHRVQRVPDTEAKGRVHTSAATVAVLPKYDVEEIDIKKDDLRVDTFRSSGAGGQHVNKTESGVRFTHIPTGVVAESTDSRSQHRNRDIALQRLYQKIQEIQEEKLYQEQKTQRKSLVGTGDRSDKIRTYNYPQNRVTDHRINLTLYSLDRIMEGDLDNIIDSLIREENADKMTTGETVG